jgi:hypothetical protein
MADNVEMANDEGADPGTDFKKKPDAPRTPADTVSEDDPDKVQQLAKAGRPGVDPDAGSD